ncbi:MAG: GDP-mannose 4,6-dehydratase, partial [Limibaculum sp.]
MSEKTALITGITGQDGAYLSQSLLEKGYEVHGAFRRSSSSNLWRLEELGIADRVKTVPLELLEYSNILKTVEAVRPDELYNLAAQSFVGISFDQPMFTSDVNAIGVARLLEAVRTVNPEIRFYQASTSE